MKRDASASYQNSYVRKTGTTTLTHYLETTLEAIDDLTTKRTKCGIEKKSTCKLPGIGQQHGVL